MGRYAEGTTVSVNNSRAELTSIMMKHGVLKFGWMWDNSTGTDQLLFEIAGGQYRIDITKPTVDEIYQRFPNHRDTDSKIEQEHKRRWRAAVLLLKAKLEFVDSGDTTLEREFLAYRLLPNGKTLEQVVIEQGLPQLVAGK